MSQPWLQGFTSSIFLEFTEPVNSHCLQFPVVYRKCFSLKCRDRIVCQISEKEVNIKLTFAGLRGGVNGKEVVGGSE